MLKQKAMRTAVFFVNRILIMTSKIRIFAKILITHRCLVANLWRLVTNNLISLKILIKNLNKYLVEDMLIQESGGVVKIVQQTQPNMALHATS